MSAQSTPGRVAAGPLFLTPAGWLRACRKRCDPPKRCRGRQRAAPPGQQFRWNCAVSRRRRQRERVHCSRQGRSTASAPAAAPRRHRGHPIRHHRALPGARAARLAGRRRDHRRRVFRHIWTPPRGRDGRNTPCPASASPPSMPASSPASCRTAPPTQASIPPPRAGRRSGRMSDVGRERNGRFGRFVRWSGRSCPHSQMAVLDPTRTFPRAGARPARTPRQPSGQFSETDRTGAF